MWSLLSLEHPSAACQAVPSPGILINSGDGKERGFQTPPRRGDSSTNHLWICELSRLFLEAVERK